MKWRIEFEKSARDTLAKLDKPVRMQGEKYLDNLLTLDNHRMLGKGLTGYKAGQWRYRVGDYQKETRKPLALTMWMNGLYSLVVIYFFA